MASQHPFEQALEVRDPTGTVVGYFLPAEKRKEWEQTCQELREECRRLRQKMAAVTGERDQYLQSLYTLTGVEVTFDEAELAEMEKNPVDLGQFLQELESEKEV